MMHCQDVIEPISRALLQARQQHQPLALPEALLNSLDEETAYAVQQRVLELRQQPAKWWKTGLMGNGQIFAAPIATSECYASAAKIDTQHFTALHVEAELAFCFNRSFQPKQQYTEAEILSAISHVAVSIEVLDSRLASWPQAPTQLHLADNQMNGALVIGEAHTWQNSINFSSQPFELYINDHLIVQNEGGHPQQNPVQLLPEFVNLCSRLGYHLEAGSWVTTGTWSGYPAAVSGDKVSVCFAGIGSAWVQL